MAVITRRPILVICEIFVFDVLVLFCGKQID